MIYCRCLICCNKFGSPKIDAINFLYNDGWFYGKPICLQCLPLILDDELYHARLNPQPTMIKTMFNFEKFNKNKKNNQTNITKYFQKDI